MQGINSNMQWIPREFIISIFLFEYDAFQFMDRYLMMANKTGQLTGSKLGQRVIPTCHRFQGNSLQFVISIFLFEYDNFQVMDKYLKMEI